ncbi:MAG TPA: response regulator [Candidatus Limnocylindrales bacterium]|nr:response regulator [Candidatus Limnocylindrales bacterium]
MLNRLGGSSGGSEHSIINVMLVDDNADTREYIKKFLAFEEREFRVVGSAGNGAEALKMAMAVKPDIIIMDINMPDMSGIDVTSQLTQQLPSAAVIMMSVQSDPNYLRKAMQAGARNFLNKPVQADELFSTIREVYKHHEPFRQSQFLPNLMADDKSTRTGTRKPGTDQLHSGHVIVVYSPQGGAGTTTIATNLAAGLMRKGIKVLIIDADLQFGDLGVFLKIQSQSTLAELAPKVNDLDIEFFDSVVSSHESGLKVLLGPQRPELADEIEAVPDSIARIIERVASDYDFIVVDTRCHLDNLLLAMTDIAAKIVLVATPTLAGIKNSKFVLDLFERMDYPHEKILFVLNKVDEDRNKNRGTIATESIEKYLKRSADAKIPNNEPAILGAVNKGVPVVVVQRDRKQSPGREMLDFADKVYTLLNEDTEMDLEAELSKPKRSGLSLRTSKN